MTRALLVAAVLSAAACAKKDVSVSAEPAAEGPLMPTTTPDAVAARLGQPDFYLYDANPKDMYEAGHIPGAKWVKFNAVRREELPADSNAQLVFYCANELCSASHEAGRQAKAFGFARVEVMPAGYFGWRRTGHAVEEPKRAAEPTKAN